MGPLASTHLSHSFFCLLLFFLNNIFINQGWCRMHRDMLVHNETNAYLHVCKTWEKVLEVSRYTSAIDVLL